MSRPRFALASLALCAGSASSAFAADQTWDNGGANFEWDTASLNWTGTAWNNAGGDGAIFGATGAGGLNLAGPINVNSLNFTVDGYSLNGTGPLNFVNGISTQTTGVVNVAAGATAKINVPINSAVGFQKIGAGVLELSAPTNFTGGIPLTSNGLLSADLLIGGTTGPIASGTVRILNSSVLPASTRVSIANGYLDIGANNVTIAELVFVNATVSAPFNPATNAAGNGVIGSGTLRVLGEINVRGVTGGNAGSNTVAANLDLGGGTQIVRSGLVSSIGLSNTIQFTGSLSNGSLLKTIGVGISGEQGSIDGMGLFGNNTYTGSTIVNSGTNVVTGTNASTSVKIAGIPAGPSGSQLILQGANGSYQSATLLQAVSGGTLVLDNNAALGASGNNQPNTPAAQNNDRVRDDAELELRDGNFTYRGRASTPASETFGDLTVAGGHAVVNITPGATGGTADLTASGNLTLAPRATMQVSSTTLGAASKLFVSGSIPAADATGILPRMFGSADFLTYSPVTGMTPYTGYALDFSTPGTNVSVTAASTVAASVNINALKRSGTFTTTIAAGQTLTIDSGMILNASGTATYAGGTIAFGAVPGIFLNGTNTVSSALTGSDGLIIASGTTTLNGDLSGLAGTISVTSGTLALATNTFAGPLHVRAGTINLNTSQTGAGLGAITLGVNANDANLIGLVPTLNFSGAGAGATFNRDIIVDNGAFTAAGAELSFSTISRLSPLSNNTGSQTFTGNVILNSPVNLQGGGGGGTGSTNFTGDVSGPALFQIPNGRVMFTGTVSNDAGFLISRGGFTAQVTFAGTATGAWPIRLNAGNNSFVAYNTGSLSSGPITFIGATTSAVPSLIPLQNSTISNAIEFRGSGIGNVGAGISAEWAGPLSGGGILSKTGPGTLTLSGLSTHSGSVQVSGGTLRVNNSMPSSAFTVFTGGTLDGIGAITGPVTVNAGGAIAAGNSIGAFSVGSLSIAGAMNAEVDLNFGGLAAADLLNVSGSVTLTAATLTLSITNATFDGSFNAGTYVIVANDGTDAVAGTFSAITGSFPAGYSAAIDYAFSGTDSIGRIGDGNDIAITIVPSPASVALLSLLAIRRRRRGVISAS
jgi:autotransporter-associated beta strand protein